MPYNFDNDVQEVIKTIDKGSRGEKIRISRITSNPKNGNKSVSVDIRNMYTDDNGEIKPTTKGLRLKSEMAAEVIVAMVEALGEDVKLDLKELLNNVE